MKLFLFSVLIFGSLNLAAQDKAGLSAPVVSKAKQFTLKTGADFLSYSNDQNDFMLFGRIENTEKIYSLVMTNDADEVVTASNIRVATEVGDNHFRLAGLALAGSNLTAFVESHNLITGRNVMAMQAVDKNGGLTSEGMLVGYFDFNKSGDPGSWHIASSPDQKKIALVAQLPHELDKPERFKYFFMDENLTMTHTGEFSVSNENGRAAAGYQGLQVDNFLVSDKGDLYIITSGPADSQHFPLIYKSKAGSDQLTAITIGTIAGDYECGNYRAIVNTVGDLVIAGYFKKKGGAVGMNALTSGSWNFSTSGKGVKLNAFEKPVPELTADHLVSGSNIYFLLGCSRAGIQVSGFSTSGDRKFEIPVARDLMAGMTMHDHSGSKAKPHEGIASGILEGKLCLIYNDLAGKYKAGGSGLVPVGLSVSNDGLAGVPVPYNALASDDTMLLPQFFSGNADHIRVLASVENVVKVITFR